MGHAARHTATDAIACATAVGAHEPTALACRIALRQWHQGTHAPAAGKQERQTGRQALLRSVVDAGEEPDHGCRSQMGTRERKTELGGRAQEPQCDGRTSTSLSSSSKGNQRRVLPS